MRRTDLLDTTPEAHRAILKLLREKSGEWSVMKAFEMTDWSRENYPEQTRAAFGRRLETLESWGSGS